MKSIILLTLLSFYNVQTVKVNAETKLMGLDKYPSSAAEWKWVNDATPHCALYRQAFMMQKASFCSAAGQSFLVPADKSPGAIATHKTQVKCVCQGSITNTATVPNGVATTSISTPQTDATRTATFPASYYIGCYRDDSSRDLKNYMGDITNGDHSACQKKCAAFTYFSLQFGVQCFCGNSYSSAPQYTKLPDSTCQQMNNGKSLYWGNGWANAVLIYFY